MLLGRYRVFERVWLAIASSVESKLSREPRALLHSAAWRWSDCWPETVAEGTDSETNTHTHVRLPFCL